MKIRNDVGRVPGTPNKSCWHKPLASSQMRPIHTPPPEAESSLCQCGEQRQGSRQRGATGSQAVWFPNSLAMSVSLFPIMEVFRPTTGSLAWNRHVKVTHLCWEGAWNSALSTGALLPRKRSHSSPSPPLRVRVRHAWVLCLLYTYSECILLTLKVSYVFNK